LNKQLEEARQLITKYIREAKQLKFDNQQLQIEFIKTKPKLTNNKIKQNSANINGNPK
jgi:ribosomal protein L16/L10AE